MKLDDCNEDEAMTEPQGSEGQRKVPHSHPYCGGCAENSSLLAVAEAKIEEWRKECDEQSTKIVAQMNALRVAEAKLAESDGAYAEGFKHAQQGQDLLIGEIGRLKEALRVERERADLCDEKWAEAVEDWRSLNERFVDSERKREEAVGLLRDFGSPTAYSDEDDSVGYCAICGKRFDHEKRCAVDRRDKFLAAAPQGEKPSELTEAAKAWMEFNEYSNLGPVAKKLWDALVAIKEEE
jgi:hypothetical protein